MAALDFSSVRDRVVAHAHTERGRALAIDLTPLDDFAAVRRAQALTAEVRELVAGFGFHVGRAVDTATLTQSAALGRTLGGLDLRSVADALASAATAYRATRVVSGGEIAAITVPYVALNELVRALTDALDERGVVTDRASPALSRIRRGLIQAQSDARERVGSIARSGHRAIQDALVTVRDGRFVVSIKAEFSGEFKGIVHDSSSSGQTLFVEPLAALEINNRVRTLRLEEEREVSRVLAALSQQVGTQAVQIESNVEVLAQLDLLGAKAALAIAMDARAPDLVDSADVDIVCGRHPLLGERAIPQSLALDEQTRLIVISGPNMGGKTVALKMVGLFVLMACAGLQLPASEGTIVGRFERVFADIGDEQSIAENMSTFSAHLRRMREMLDAAGPRALVLVDEIGGGTEPNAGAALAVAFLERLLAVGACGVVTTHDSALKLFAHGTPRVANASVRFDPQSFSPTYVLDVGSPGQSLAFPLARSLGMDDAILARAQALLESQERDYEAALSELAQRNADLASERESAAAERAHVVEREREVRAQRDALQRERDAFVERAEARMAQALREFANELQRRAADNAARAKVTASQSALADRTLAAVRRDLGIVPEPASEGRASAIAVGDRVRIASLRQEGDVAEDYGDTILVALGSLKTVVKKADASPVAKRSGGAKTTVRSSGAKPTAAANTHAELDVRGNRYVDAQPLVERWIDDALLAGNSSLRLIHGKGTGLLGRGLQEYLRDHPAVASYRYGNADEGDGGVTIVELRE